MRQLNSTCLKLFKFIYKFHATKISESTNLDWLTIGRSAKNPYLFIPMGSETPKASMFFFPWILTRSHLIPMVDTARLFAAYGAKVTIITTPGYVELYRKTIERDQSLGRDIGFHTVKLPTAEFGLPEGCENSLSIVSLELTQKLFMCIMKLQEPIEKLLEERRPDCIVSDMSYSWTADVAEQLRIPRILFHVTGLFPLCCEESLRRYKPHENVSTDTEHFTLPGLPNDNIKFTKRSIPLSFTTKTAYSQFQDEVLEAELKSYGVIINSFYELEQVYADYYRNKMGRKLWLVGPVHLFNKKDEDLAERGEKNSIDGNIVLDWLDSKEPNSVIYISFGSLVRMAPDQFLEIAHGLEASGHSFIWVARDISQYGGGDKTNGAENRGKMFPEGFEERMEKSGKGLIVKSWAPQLLILQHQAIGGFMTHCGWNSTIEGIVAGLPLITWPFVGEQFFNESLLTDVLGIGIRAGNEEWTSLFWEAKVTVTREKVEAAIKRLLGGGNDVEEMRKRAKELSFKAKRAVEQGGSSDAGVISLIDELNSRTAVKYSTG